MTHRKRRAQRCTIAGVMMVIYLLITLTPLAPCAMHSKTVAHAVTEECVGDCDICGCSPKSRADHTCCCSKKRAQQSLAHKDNEDGTSDCSKKKPVDRKTVFACACPCGSEKKAVLAAGTAAEVLPFHFTEQFGIYHTHTVFSDPSNRLTSRYGDPPEPPPQLPLIA